MSDINWKSYVGPEDNGKVVELNDWINPPDGGLGYSDIFKCSNVDSLVASGITIDASKCKEDAIDCVRGSAYRFYNVAIIGSVTIKGAIDGWRIDGCLVHKVIELGQFDNYWTPGRKPTRNGLIIDTCKPDGGKIHVVCWDAEVPQVFNTNVQVWRVPKFVWFPYFCFRYVWIRIFGP